MDKKECTTNQEFILALSGVNSLNQEIVDALYEAGCDDATISLRLGTVYLSFDREAESLAKAILSAIGDVHKAGICASVKYVDDCNLVSQSDIARRINRSRQLVGQYIAGKRGPGNFPGPVCDLAEGRPMWMWCEVSGWLYENNIVPREVLDDSRVIAAINAALEYIHHQQHDSALLKEVFQVMGEVVFT